MLLCGGVGGAKLAQGLALCLAGDSLTIIANTGDDFVHCGLPICPDIDTILYSLAGLAHPERGWGRADESYNAMDSVRALGGETWFTLGDRDIGLSMVRAQMIAAGASLSSVTAHLAGALGIACTLTPMSDQSVQTYVRTPDCTMAFQDYFVRHQCAPACLGVEYEGAAHASAAPAAAAALARPDLRGIIIANSNPWFSIAPMLAIGDLRDMLLQRHVPCIAVSPIVGGRALKGPLDRIMRDLGLPVEQNAIAGFYGPLIDMLLIDPVDADQANAMTSPAITCAERSTVMVTRDDKLALAEAVLAQAAAGRAGAQRHAG